MSTPRDDRLRADFLLLKALDEASSILSLEATGDPPDRYTVTFRGQGRDRSAQTASNVVRYERKGGRGVQLAATAGEVMFIDENTPTPQIPPRPPIPRPRPRGEGDVIYIGPE